jgi:hypothetical protein
MKKIVFLIIIIATISCKSQVRTKLSFETLNVKLIDFLEANKDFNSERAEKYRKEEYSLNVIGVSNNLSSGELENGMYSFGLGPHSRAYFVLVENQKFFILNIATRKGLNDAIQTTLDFCERNKFCVDITNDYIRRLIGVHYNINKNPENRSDINCVKGVNDFKSLP